MLSKIIKLSIASVFLFAGLAHAARVTQSKNNKVLIDLEGADLQPNQDLFLLNAQNKKVALVKIMQVKNGKAIASITKGKSDGNETVLITGAKTATTKDENTYVPNSGRANSKKVFNRAESRKASVVVSMMTNSMTTKQADGTQPIANTEDVSMKGSTFGVTGVVDWPVWNRFSIRGTAGYEPFKAIGTAKFKSCDGLLSFECTAEITYLSFGGFIRYDFLQQQTLFWVGAGATLKQPLAKKTTALKVDDVKTTMTLALAGGLDYFINPKFFIPVSLEYQTFLKSETVDANILMIRAGFGMAL